VFPNLVNAQLPKELKQQIKNNDVSSIQLKLRTQIEVNAKTTLEKAPINGEHMSSCVGSNLSKGCQNLIIIKNVKKVHQKIRNKRWKNQKGGHHLKGSLQIHQANISWMCHRNNQMLMTPKLQNKLPKKASYFLQVIKTQVPL
jgi:ribosomal protein L24